MKLIISLIIFVGVLIVSTSCGVNSHVMFKSTDTEVITENIPISPTDDFRLAPDDKISFSLFVEDGKRIIDMSTGVGMESGNQRLGVGNISYLVRPNGNVELPMVGVVKVDGLSIIEVQEKLKMLYSVDYIDPFVQVEVTNRRVIVFPGSGGGAKVVPIVNNNTTLMEAIALAGGITERGKAKVIKLMRQSNQGRKVYQIDLSTMDGLKYADMIVQSNDYIYVEPTKQLSREFLKEVTPIISLLSSAILIITLFTTSK
ncbi:polysaccharide biosynthesis/export family protein [Brumimicrobium mesophilum]|uniref:polysaccharide biosynthesis/export family protein n=1 Tax=Brumimicrobium mesophilum TaxID=392717 RepID=UPI000D141233|nr:polysaccharide biosynthesis/export family protein [Brumimicrobium mesophilum]